MDKSDMQNGDRASQISAELGRLLAEQTEFFKKGARLGHTPQELEEYAKSRERIRELFTELERSRKAA